jgi:CRP/FNR family cyclic AMP-dependent transcriptional regulator
MTVSPLPMVQDDQSAIFLSEYILDLNSGAGFLSGLNDMDQARIRKAGSRRLIKKGEGLFFQGDPHTGIWIIESGRMRTFYAAPSGRELTLAYWTSGHFVGGPEVFGRGRHVWSGDALEDTKVLFISGMALRDLVSEIPAVALKIIDGLVAKGTCYSALIQMLGTRTVSERLEQLLVILASTHGRHEGDVVVIDRSITYEQVASIVGASRQWVTQSLDKLQKEGVLEVSRKQIAIYDVDRLSEGH